MCLSEYPRRHRDSRRVEAAPKYQITTCVPYSIGLHQPISSIARTYFCYLCHNTYAATNILQGLRTALCRSSRQLFPRVRYLLTPLLIPSYLLQLHCFGLLATRPFGQQYAACSFSFHFGHTDYSEGSRSLQRGRLATHPQSLCGSETSCPSAG